MEYAIELDKKQSRLILECGCRGQLVVQIQSKSWPQPIQAWLLAGDQEGLRLHADCSEQIDNSSLISMYCQVDLELEDGKFFFESPILSVRNHEHTMHLLIAWPETIVVRQRRRSSRTRMASSSKVQLSRQQEDQFWSYEGQLYNLSEDGLAFMLSSADADHMEIAQQWWVCFEIPEQAHHYKFKGTLLRKVPSSSEGYVIIGIEFDGLEIEEDELGRLCEFLKASQQAKTVMGELK